jgi:flagellar basal-body rod protein FlgF
MLVNSKKMDVIANNLANTDTSGFKKDTVVLQSFPDILTSKINDSSPNMNPSGIIGNLRFGMDIGEVNTYFTQGQLAQTSRSLDFSITSADNAFFTVTKQIQNNDTNTLYTRDGSFILNAEGYLTTESGDTVLGQNGPIQLQGTDFSIKPDGKIIQNGRTIDTLLITQFQDSKTLVKYGNNLLTATQNAVQVEFSGQIQQGFIEKSNVSTVKEMVDMISTMRAYEANQKMIQFQDTTLEKAINEVGTLR